MNRLHSYEDGEPSPLSFSDGESSKAHEGKILAQNGYSLKRQIGEGSYATVKLARHRCSEKPLAVKVISKAKAPKDFLEKFLPRELHIMKQIDHPNIIAMHSCVDLPLHVYLFMELAECGDLLEHIKSSGALSDIIARRMFHQLLSAIRYCHDRNITHRDLKCENILLDRELNAKLTDFGFSRLCVDQNGRRVLSRTFCGSSAYAAPEILRGIPYNPKMYDVWSLGVILYIMVYGSMPFDDSNLVRMLHTIVREPLTFPSPETVRPTCQSLLRHMLQPDVMQRATLGQVNDSDWLRANQSL